MNIISKIFLLLFALLALNSCQKRESKFIEENKDSIGKTEAFIEDFKNRNGVFPTSRECHDWIIRQNIHKNAGITILNVRFDKEKQIPLGFDIFDGEEWVCIYNPNSKKVEKKIPFSSYSFSFD